MKYKNNCGNYLSNIFNYLFDCFGPQHWWPGHSIDEIIIGAVLTQNTNWKNVEKAIVNLKENDLLCLEKIKRENLKRISKLIKPAGFFNQKAKYLKNIADYFDTKLFDNNNLPETRILREELLGIKGIGNETADSILLYAFNRPVFIIDAYTYRIFSRHFPDFPKQYDNAQLLFHNNLKMDSAMFNEYHALIVKCAKMYCRKNPECKNCPLNKVNKN